MVTYIFADLNVRDEFVTSSKDIMIYDTKVVVQSVWRLLNTQVGEIPNFRSYGLDIKRFIQYPLNKETIETIYSYVKDRLKAFESRADIIRANVDVDFEQGIIYMEFFLRVKSTGETIKLPTWVVQIGS